MCDTLENACVTPRDLLICGTHMRVGHDVSHKTPDLLHGVTDTHLS